MGFDWAAAGAGSVDGMEMLIARDLKEREMKNREEQVSGMREDRAMNRQIAQQNADSLAASRQAQVDERTAKQQQRQKLFEGARATLANPDAIDEQFRPIELARAKHILTYGEDLPDTVVSSYYGKPKEKPAYVPMTPEEKKDFEYKQEVEGKTRARFRAPARPPAASTKKYGDWDVSKYGDPELPSAVQNFIVKISQQKASPAEAQEEFMKVIAGGLQGNRYLNIEKANRLINAIYATRDPKKNMPAAGTIPQGEEE
jgi:hypothetical protein